MKKNILILLVVTMMICSGLTGCGGSNASNTEQNNSSQQSEEKDDTEQNETENDVQTSEKETENTTQNTENTEVKEEKVVTYTDILLNPTENGKYYPKSADYSDIWFAAADIDGDGEVELFIGDRYDEGMQQPDRIYNVLSLKDGKIKDLNGNWVISKTAMFILFDNGILYDGFDDGSQLGTYINLKTGEYFEGEISDDVYTSMWQSKEIPLVWYQANEENVNTILGGK